MPYIHEDEREALESGGDDPGSVGQLNFKITRIIDRYLQQGSGLQYSKLNDVIGVLECAKLELYRRIAAPYEDKKKEENGEVYLCNRVA